MSFEDLLTPYFLFVLNQSKMASFVIFAVLIARFILKKTNQPTCFTLWSLVLIRLIYPVSLELPFKSDLQQEIKPITVEQFQIAPKYVAKNPDITENDQVYSNVPNETTKRTDNSVSFSEYAVVLWFSGMILFLFAYLISVYKTKKLLRYGSKQEDNVYLVDHLKTPFVWSILKPKIYLPSHITEKEKYHVLAHERYHIKRCDHITRLLASFVLMLHWFNPFVWIAFTLAGKDMELSVDEYVLKKYATKGKETMDFAKGYAETLLFFATKNQLISPLAFGQGDIQERIVNIMSLKKKSTIVGGLCSVLALGSVVGFAMQHKTTLTTITPVVHYVGGSPIENYPKMTESVDLKQILPEIDILSFEPRFDSMNPLDKYPSPFVMEKGNEKFEEFLQILSQIELHPVDYDAQPDGYGTYFDNGRFWVDKAWWWGDYLEQFDDTDEQNTDILDSDIKQFTCTLGDSDNNIYYTISIGSHGLALLDIEEVGVSLEAYPCIVENTSTVIDELLTFSEGNTQLKNPEGEIMEHIFMSGFPVTASTSVSATLIVE